MAFIEIFDADIAPIEQDIANKAINHIPILKILNSGVKIKGANVNTDHDNEKNAPGERQEPVSIFAETPDKKIKLTGIIVI